MVLGDFAVTAVVDHLLVGVEYGGQTCGDHFAFVDDALALLYDTHRGHGFLIGLVDEAARGHGVERDGGLEHVGEACGRECRPDVAVAQGAVEVLIGAEGREIVVGGHGDGHVVVNEPHGRELARGDALIGVAVDDAVFIDIAYGADYLVFLRRSNIQSFGGVEPRGIVGDEGLLGGQIAYVHRLEIAVDAVLEHSDACRVEVHGDVKRSGEQRVAPGAVDFVDIVVLVGARQEIHYKGHRRKEEEGT